MLVYSSNADVEFNYSILVKVFLSHTSSSSVVFPTITILYFQWFLFFVAIVTASPQNLAAFSNVGPMTCHLVASFKAHNLSFSSEFQCLGVKNRRFSYYTKFYF